MTEGRVRAAFHEQAGHCRRLGSPFTARLCELLGNRLDRSTAIGRLVLGWRGEPDTAHDALPLRLAGALHAIVLGGGAPELAAAYPPNAAPDDDDLWGRVRGVLAAAGDTLSARLGSAPQTNEVRRSAVLMAGLAEVAAATGLPLGLLELGASAGLNLVLDRYAYRLGGRSFGAPGSSLLLEPAWTGPAPASARPAIASRRGVDLTPFDLSLAADRERLLGYVWADQDDRLARTATAIAIAAQDPPPVDRGEAAEWLRGLLAETPPPGVARVVLHSIAYQYFGSAAQADITQTMERAGRAATASTPLAWLRFEIASDTGAAGLRLASWPGGHERLLALADPHAAAVVWHGAAYRK